MHSKFVYHPGILVIQDSRTAGCILLLKQPQSLLPDLGSCQAGFLPEVAFMLKEMALSPSAQLDLYGVHTFEVTTT